jgi:hypothetical protein
MDDSEHPMSQEAPRLSTGVFDGRIITSDEIKRYVIHA